MICFYEGTNIRQNYEGEVSCGPGKSGHTEAATEKKREQSDLKKRRGSAGDDKQ